MKGEKNVDVAGSFRDLRVYQLTRAASAEVFQITKAFPREERFSLTDQIRRSARATKAMISEAWARRRYKAVFVNKLDEALGEANETRSWLHDVLDCGYLHSGQFAKMESDWRSIASMLARMIDRAADFCKYAFRHRLPGDGRTGGQLGRHGAPRGERFGSMNAFHLSLFTFHLSPRRSYVSR